MASVGGAQELDDFGLPIRKYVSPKEGKQDERKDKPIKEAGNSSNSTTKEPEKPSEVPNNKSGSETVESKVKETTDTSLKPTQQTTKSSRTSATNSDDDDDFQDAPSTPLPEPKPQAESQNLDEAKTPVPTQLEFKNETSTPTPTPKDNPRNISESYENEELPKTSKRKNTLSKDVQAISGPSIKQVEASKHADEAQKTSHADHTRNTSVASTNQDVSEFSHQHLTAHGEEKKDDEDEGWQAMPAYAPYDIYDDDNRLVAKEHNPEDDDNYGYGTLGGAGKGYTRVLDDEDAESQTSMDDNTRYLFKDPKSTSMADMDEEQRDAVSQLQATKDLLTEGQRIAYVGITRLELSEMVKEAESIEQLRKIKKEVQMAAEALKMWSRRL